jgi:hypothetical protein
VARHTEYTDEIAREICDAIASSSKSLAALCKDHPHWPDKSGIAKWRIRYPKFRAMYEEAKINQVECYVDEIVEIADDSTSDTLIKTDKQGNEYETCNSEWIARSRLRVDTRKWMAARLCPRLYGDKLEKSTDDNSKALMEKLIDKL